MPMQSYGIKLYIFFATILVCIGSIYFRKISNMIALFIFSMSLLGVVVLSEAAYVLFFISFILIGISKFISGLIATKDLFKGYRPRNFIYNGLLPYISGVASHLIFLDSELNFAVAAMLSVVISDTVASDFGTSISAKAYLITNFSKVQQGRDGAITIFGTTISIFFTIIFGILFFIFIDSRDIQSVLLLISFGLLGNIIDSILGATVQKIHLLTNEGVNLVSIACIGILSFFLQKWL